MKIVKTYRDARPTWEPTAPTGCAPSVYLLLEWHQARERQAAKLASTIAAINDALGREPTPIVTEVFEAPQLYDDDVGRLQLRSAPLPALAGAEIRIDLRLDDLGGEDLVDDVAFALRSMASRRTAAERSAADVRRVADAAIARRHRADAPARVTMTGIRASATLLAPFDAVVEVEVLGHGLTPVVARAQGGCRAELDAALDALLATHLRRADLLARLRAIGARGLVEEPASRVLDFAGRNMGGALALLEQRNLLDLDYAFPEGFASATLHWRDGVLKTNFRNHSGGIDLVDGVLTAWKNTLPAKSVLTRPGKRLGRLVQDPHVPAELLVLAAARAGPDTSLMLDIPAMPFRI